MADRKALQISSTGQVAQFADGDAILTNELQLASGTAINLFTDLTGAGTVNIASGVTSGTITIGGTGSTAAVHNLTVAGTETVTGTSTLNGDVNLGDNSGDTISLGGGTSDFIRFDGYSITDLTFDTTAAARKITTDDASNALQIAPVLNGALDIDTTGTGIITIDSAAAVSIDGGAASNFTTSSGALTLDGNGGVNIVGNAAEIDLTTSSNIDVNATAGAVTIDSAAASNFTVTGNTLLLATTGANDLTLSPGSAQVVITTSDANDALSITVDSGGTPLTANVFVGTGTPQGSVTGSIGDLYLEVSTGAPYFCTGTINWSAVGSAEGNGLQAAYGVTPTITTAGTVPIDYTLTSGGFNVTTSATGDIQFDNGTNNFLFIDGSTGANTVSAIGAALTLSTVTSGDVNIAPVSGGSADITVAGVGVVDINAAAGGVTVDATAGTIALTTTTSGAITADSAGAISLDAAAASNLTTSSGALTVDGAGGVNIAGNAAEIDLTTTGVIDINGTGGVTVDATSTDIALTTTTAGDLDFNSAADILADAAAGISLNAATASNFTVSGATADLTLGARAATITLNELGDTILSGFTATSIVGALNELKSASSDVTTAVTAGEALTKGDLVYLNKADGSEAWRADADAAASSVVLGFCEANIADAAAGDVILVGEVVVNTDLSGATVGDVVYLSNTEGEVTTTAPSGAGDTILRVGIVTTAAVAGTGKIAIQIGTAVSL